MRKSGSLAQYVSSVAIAFVFSLLLFVCISLSVASATLFSVPGLQGQVYQSGFDEKALGEIHEIFRSYAAAASMNEKVLIDSVTLLDVQDATTSNIQNAFTQSGEYDFAAYNKRLNQALQEYAKQNGIELDTNQMEGLAKLATSCEAVFKAHTSSFIIDLIASLVQPAKKPAMLGIIVTTIIMVLLVVALFVVQKKIRYVLQFLIYGTSASVLMCGMLAVLALVSGITERINIDPQSMRLLLTAWLNNWIKGYFVGLGIGVLSLLALIVSYNIALKQHQERVKDARQRHSGRRKNSTLPDVDSLYQLEIQE